MSDGAGHFHAEAKCVGHAVRPAQICLRLVRAVERRVDLHAGENLGVAFQVTAIRWKKACFPGRNRPAGTTDVDAGIYRCSHVGLLHAYGYLSKPTTVSSGGC